MKTYGDRQGVILVDNGNDSHTEQLGKCVLCIEILRSICNIVSSDKDLSDWLLQMGEQCIP